MSSASPTSEASNAGSDAATSGQSRTTIVSIAAAAVLMVLKLVTGLLSGSLGLISAGVESSGDVVAAVFTFFAVRIGGRPADRDHPYGHRRAENLGALGEAGILIIGGVFVAVDAGKRTAEGGAAPDTGWYVFAVMVIALAVDLSRTVVSLRAAQRFASPALRSNAFHFGADMVGSVAVLAGLIASRAGFSRGDAIAAVVVAGLVFAAAARLIAVNARALMDTAPAEATDAAERAVLVLAPDIELRRLRLRESAGRYFADVVVAVPPGRAVVEAHQAADAVEAAIGDALPGSDVVVHIEPRRRGLDLRDRVLAAALAEPLVREAHDIAIFESARGVFVSLHLKLPDELSVRDAHDVAERVEQTIRNQTGVIDVQTHLEPLERPIHLASLTTDRREVRAIEELVARHTDARARTVRVLPTESGEVLFLTVQVGDRASLTDAHQLASQLEEDLRAHLPDVAEVVVHTEP
jgi:cation diffusion facilitator family transporter